MQHIRGDWVVMDDGGGPEPELVDDPPEFIKQSAKKVQTKKHGTLKVNTKGAKHGRR